MEYFRIPSNVLVICVGKSTYARCGIIVNVTPLEPSWEGHVTLEFSNTTNLPAKIYAGRVWHRCSSSSPTSNATPPTGTGEASIRGSAASPCREPRGGGVAPGRQPNGQQAPLFSMLEAEQGPVRFGEP